MEAMEEEVSQIFFFCHLCQNFRGSCKPISSMEMILMIVFVVRWVIFVKTELPRGGKYMIWFDKWRVTIEEEESKNRRISDCKWLQCQVEAACALFIAGTALLKTMNQNAALTDSEDAASEESDKKIV